MAGLLGKMERIREALGLQPAPIPTLIAQANAHLELSLHGGYMQQADIILHALFGGTGAMATSPNNPAAAQSVTAQLSGLDLSGRASTPPSPVPVEPPHRVETPPYHLNGAGDDAEAAELKGATDSVSVQPEPEPTPETVQTPPHDLPGVPPAPSDLEQPSRAYSIGSSTRSDSSAGCPNSAEQKEPRSRIDGRRREPEDSDGSATPPRSQSPSKQEEPLWGVASGRGGRTGGRAGGRGFGRGTGAAAAPGMAPISARSPAEAYMQAYAAARASQETTQRAAAGARAPPPAVSPAPAPPAARAPPPAVSPAPAPPAARAPPPAVSPAPAPPAARAPPPAVSEASAAEKRGQNLGKVGDEFWDCVRCKTKNWSRRDTCRKCKTGRPAVVELKAAQLGMPGVRAEGDVAGGGRGRLKLTGASLAAVMPAPRYAAGGAAPQTCGGMPQCPPGVFYHTVPPPPPVQSAVLSSTGLPLAIPTRITHAGSGRGGAQCATAFPSSMGYAQQAIHSMHGGGDVGVSYTGHPRRSTLVVRYEDDEVIEYAHTEGSAHTHGYGGGEGEHHPWYSDS